jgi:hypothetical protein
MRSNVFFVSLVILGCIAGGFLLIRDQKNGSVSATLEPIVTSDVAKVKGLVASGMLSKDYAQAVELLDCTKDQYPWSLEQVETGSREWKIVVPAGNQDRFEICDLRPTEGVLMVQHYVSDVPVDLTERHQIWTLNPEPAAWTSGPFVDVAFAAATTIGNAETTQVTRAVEALQKTANDAGFGK